MYFGEGGGWVDEVTDIDMPNHGHFTVKHRLINMTAVPGPQVLKIACISLRTLVFDLYTVAGILVSNK